MGLRRGGEEKKLSKRWFSLLVGLALFVNTIAIYFFLVVVILPFKPYIVYGYSAMPSAGCPDDLINLTVDGDVRTSWWITFTGGVLKGYWENLELGGTTGEEELAFNFDKEPLSPGRAERKGLLLRRIPTAPGKYRVATNYHIKGRVLGYPQEDEFTYVSPAIFEALSPDDPRCVQETP